MASCSACGAFGDGLGTGPLAFQRVHPALAQRDHRRCGGRQLCASRHHDKDAPGRNGLCRCVRCLSSRAGQWFGRPAQSQRARHRHAGCRRCLQGRSWTRCKTATDPKTRDRRGSGVWQLWRWRGFWAWQNGRERFQDHFAFWVFGFFGFGFGLSAATARRARIHRSGSSSRSEPMI